MAEGVLVKAVLVIDKDLRWQRVCWLRLSYFLMGNGGRRWSAAELCLSF